MIFSTFVQVKIYISSEEKYDSATRPFQIDVPLVIPQKFLRRRESGRLDEGASQILRCAQDDTRKAEILRCAQDDTRKAVILSAAKDLLSTYG